MEWHIDIDDMQPVCWLFIKWYEEAIMFSNTNDIFNELSHENPDALVNIVCLYMISSDLHIHETWNLFIVYIKF
jgi:hypothetical protein